MPSDSKVSILLVDDQRANLLALQAVLEDLGHDLVTADSGESALRLLLSREFAVVLLDVQMHGLDGFETAKLIRSRGNSRHTPIIFLTAYDNNRLPVEEAYALGAVDYLVKPVVPLVLRAKVAGFVELFEKTEQVKRQAEQIRQIERREFELRLAREDTRARESEARNTAILNAALDCIISMDHEGRILEFNPAAERTFGYLRSDVVGRQMAELLVPPQLREQHQRGMATYLATGTGPVLGRRLELPALRADGSEFPVELAITRINKEGPPVFTAYLRDISERKWAEEALRESNRLKDEFLAILAHELRNPLAPIRNALYILQQPEIDPAMTRQLLDMGQQQVEHMARMLDDLLDVSRISQGRFALRKEIVDLASLIMRAVAAVRLLVEEHRHELEISISDEPLRVEGDTTRLEQVLANLLNNACKYMDEGGKIRLTAGLRDGQVEIGVKDLGIGIPPEALPRIFEMFSQVDRSLERSRSGLGIGLALVRRLVEMHGGTIEAKSEGAGRGSEFVVRLPATAAEPPGPREAEQEKEQVAAHAKRRILVVDDNQDAATTLGILLRLKGNEVRTAFDGLEAVAAAEAFQPQAILLDIGMPKMNGYDAARRIRQEARGRPVMLVATTGWGQQQDIARSKEAGFDHHLVKPVDFAQLEKLLASLPR